MFAVACYMRVQDTSGSLDALKAEVASLRLQLATAASSVADVFMCAKRISVGTVMRTICLTPCNLDSHGNVPQLSRYHSDNRAG